MKRTNWTYGSLLAITLMATAVIRNAQAATGSLLVLFDNRTDRSLTGQACISDCASVTLSPFGNTNRFIAQPSTGTAILSVRLITTSPTRRMSKPINCDSSPYDVAFSSVGYVTVSSSGSVYSCQASVNGN